MGQDGSADGEGEEETAEGRRGLTLAQARQVRRDLGGAAGEAWWTLVTTGMRPGELWREDGLEWKVEGTRVRIYRRGKSIAARRVIPRLVQAVEPGLRLREFRDAFRSMQVRPYWARYTFKALMLEAGVPINRVEQYLGHSTKSLDRLYGKVRLKDWVAADRERYRRLLEIEEFLPASELPWTGSDGSNP